MAFNIPVNLMNTAASPLHSVTGAAASGARGNTAIQPTTGGTNTRESTSNGGGFHKQSAREQALIFKRRTTGNLAKTPDKAEPKSVLAAQTTSQPEMQHSLSAPAVFRPATLPDAPRQSELDRFAPPNPLPTAPILQLAASYAALTKREE